MPNLVGTGLNQVPTNSMLGGLAYQDPEHASIKNLDLKNLSQINSEIADTAVDVFVYDTSKDSDGGAWRKRTQNTSWYNETLGTATRGTRKEFPAVAVIVATIDDVIIYDGDDPDLPMWMIFESGSSGNAWENYYLGRGTGITFNPDVTGVAMLNATLVVGKDGAGAGNFVESYTEIDFISDNALHRDAGSAQLMNNSIVSRNGSAGGYHNVTSTFGVIVQQDINDVAMTVLPNAPIDPSTGLPIPTIAVGTDGGVSVIRDDGIVVDYTYQVTTNKSASNVYLSKTGRLQYSTRSSSGGYVYYVEYDKLSSSNVSSAPNVVLCVAETGGSGITRILPKGHIRSSAIANEFTALGLHPNTYTNYQGGLFLHKTTGDVKETDGASLPNDNFMGVHIRPDYNTGWMYGDIKGAFLSDTVTEKDGVNYALSALNGGTNRLTSLTYSNGDTDWQMVDNASTSNGYVNVDMRGLTIGQTYKISMTWSSNATLDSGYYHRVAHLNGLSGENGTDFTHWNKTNGSSETLTGVFIAQSVNDDDLIIYANAITLNISNFKIEETDDINGFEKLGNYDFTSNFTTEWEVKNSANTSYDAANDRVTVTSTQNYSGIRLRSTKLPHLAQGKRYIMTVDIHSINNPIRFGIVSGGTKDSVNSTGSHQLMFTAQASVSEVFVEKPTGSNSTFVLNSVSIREAEEDRSVNNKGLAVYGTITKSVVATGADLVGYGPFSTSNYLEQPYNSDLLFGTSDFCISGWHNSNSSNTSVYEDIICFGNTGKVGYASNEPGSWFMQTNKTHGWTLYYRTSVGSGHSGWTAYNAAGNFNDHSIVGTGTWYKITLVKSGDKIHSYTNDFYHGSQDVTSGSFTTSSNLSDMTLKIGWDGGTSYNYPSIYSKMALWRISKSAPSAEQVKKMYEDEKCLFHENAKATLYGSSDAVTALAYDDTTNLLHVGTSAGRSEFQGLRRINNTTTAVTTAISAHDEFIIEQ